MATYVSLLHYTEQGIRNIKEGPQRLEATKKAFQAAGGELKQFYLAMGAYDIVLVSEAPDDETVARLALTVGALVARTRIGAATMGAAAARSFARRTRAVDAAGDPDSVRRVRRPGRARRP